MFPIHLRLPFRTFEHYEGLYFLIAIGVSYIISRRAVKKHEINPDQFDNFIMSLLLGAVVMGRLFSLLFWNFDSFKNNPMSLFYFWQGGISITGGLAGGCLGAWIYGQARKFPFWKVFAIMSPIVMFGQGLGRIGCFLNGDAFGVKTDLPWGLRFPRYGHYFPPFPQGAENATPGPSSFAWQFSYGQGWVDKASTLTPKLHPTQLYETLLDWLMMLVLLFLSKRTLEGKVHPKVIFFVHLGSYSLVRFFLEFIRGDRAQVISALHISSMQLGLLISTLVCLGLSLFFGFKKGERLIP